MAGASYPVNMAAHGPLRSLELYLDELLARLKKLPMTSPDRGRLVTLIREVEAELDARSGT